MKSSALAPCMLALALVGGCSDRRSVGRDAGPVPDAPIAGDTSVAADAPSAPDAASLPDAFASVDAAARDAAPPRDAATRDAATRDAATRCAPASTVATLPGVGTTGSRFATTAGPFDVGCGDCPYAALVQWTHPGGSEDYAFCLYVGDNPTYIARYDGVAPTSCDEPPDACTATATRVSVPSSGTHHFLLCRPTPGEVEIELFSADWPCP